MVIRVNWLLYTLLGPGCYLMSHNLPRYEFQFCHGFPSFWLGTQTASISTQADTLSCENARPGSSVEPLTRALVPLISRHNQPASFLLSSAAFRLLHSTVNTNSAGLGWVVEENVSGLQHPRILHKVLFLCLFYWQGKKIILPVTLIQNQRNSSNVTFYKYLPMSQLTFSLYPIG